MRTKKKTLAICRYLYVGPVAQVIQIQGSFIFFINLHAFCVVFTKRILFVEKSFFENTPVRRVVEGCFSVQSKKEEKYEKYIKEKKATTTNELE